MEIFESNEQTVINALSFYRSQIIFCRSKWPIPEIWLHLKALVVKNSVLHDFGFGKVSQIHKTFLMELQLFGWRHFSKTEVVQNTVLNH